jgi:two-component system cell cycle sensor histidine kinase/response regulator CckA
MPSPSRRYRVLIVDDEPEVRLVLDRILTNGGYHTTQAFDAADAVRLLASWKPVDLLVTDVAMPDMTGDELVRQARTTQPDLKVLYVTGFADRLSKDQPAAKREPLLEKPFTPAALLEAVSRVLFGHPRGIE